MRKNCIEFHKCIFLARKSYKFFAFVLFIRLWTFSIIYIYKGFSVLQKEYLFLLGSKLNGTESEHLFVWDETRCKSLIPTNVFLLLSSLVGFSCNVVVIRLPRKYEGRYFIPYLALAHLVAVIISVELHMVNNFFYVTFKMETFCKWNFVCGFLLPLLLQIFC